MTTANALAKRFEAFAADAAQLTERAAATASAAPAGKSDIAAEIAAIASSMATMADRLAMTLRATARRSKKAA